VHRLRPRSEWYGSRLYKNAQNLRARWNPALVDPIRVDARDAERARALEHLVRACDVVFGSSSTLLAVIATWQAVSGAARLPIVIALWTVPGFNLGWSVITLRSNRLLADVTRGVMCIPLTSYIYVAEPTGILKQLWLPALMLSVGVCLVVGLGTRRARAGMALAIGYAGGLVVTEGLATHVVAPGVLGDALGLCLTGAIVSLVAAHLGRTLDVATEERDEAAEQRARAELTLRQLTVAIADFQHEMERRIAVEAELCQVHKLEAVGQLAAGIAHEINTPVQFVGDTISFLRTAVTDLVDVVRHDDTAERAGAAEAADLPFLIEELPKALDRAQDGLSRVATIVRSMKSFAHPDGAEMAQSDLNHAIQATLVIALNEYKYVAEVVTDFAPLPCVSCFVGEINQAVLNIVVNGAHAIADVVGDSGARGTLRVSTRQVGDEVEIAIADTGTGIPEAHRARIFDRFFTTKDIGRGTGQGLAIAHHVVVDKHHGKLTFETELGRGTTFFIRLPVDTESRVVRDVA